MRQEIGFHYPRYRCNPWSKCFCDSLPVSRDMVRLGLSLSLPASRKPIYGAAGNHFRSVSDRTYTVKQKFDQWRKWLDLALPEKVKPTILTSISGSVRR